MKKYQFEPERAIGAQLTGYDRQQLCEFVIKLCKRVKEDAGPGVYRGGLYPDNISISENGELAIGPASPEGWSGQELEFLPPELYWNSRPGPASDVYAIGMLLYYALNGGKLPFDGQCRDAQLRRMGGDEFPLPAAAGRRLGDIIRKATAFKASARYQSMDELHVMAESCLKNLYLNGSPSAQVIFNKSDDDLSELEKLMVGIIEKEEEQPLPEEEILAEAFPPPAEEVEEAEEEELYGADNEEEGLPDEEQTEYTEYYDEADEYEETAERIPHLYEEMSPELEPVVLSKQPEIIPAVRYTRDAERDRRMADKVKKRRRRPVAVVLVLCALLVIAAIIFNALARDISRNHENAMQAAQAAQSAESSGTADPGADENQLTEEAKLHQEAQRKLEEERAEEERRMADEGNVLDIQPDSVPSSYIPGQPQEEEQPSGQSETNEEWGFPQKHRYEIYIEDISWTDAQAKCKDMGGHLLVINDFEELEEIVELADNYSVGMMWLGGHRENDVIVWEDGSSSAYENWAKGEPSFVDSSDGAKEDYVLLWYNNGWYYNDSRNDPCAEFPQWYSGKMAYVCEFGD